MDDFGIILSVFFVSNLLNANAVEIIQQNETASQTDDIADSSRYLVLPPTSNSPNKAYVKMTVADVLTEMAKQAINDERKTSKTVQENVKVTIRKHSQANQSKGGDDKTHVIKQGVFSSKTYSMGPSGNSNAIKIKYNPYSRFLNDAALTESSKIVQTNDTKLNGNLNENASKSKMTENGPNVNKNNLIEKKHIITNVGSDLTEDQGSSSFASQKIKSRNETVNTKNIKSNDSIVSIEDHTNNIDTDSKVLYYYDTYDGGVYNDNILPGHNMTEEHDSTENIQSKTEDDKLVNNGVSEGSQRDDNVTENSSTQISGSKDSANIRKTLVNIQKTIKTDYDTKAPIKIKPSVEVGVSEDATVHSSEKEKLNVTETAVKAPKIDHRAIFGDVVCERNVQNLKNFWLLLDQYVYTDKDVNLYRFEKLLTLFNIFQKLNEIKAASADIDMMINNLIEILDHPHLDVKIETEKHNSRLKSNKFIGATTKVVTIERDLQDDNIYVQKFETKLDKMSFPKNDGRVSYNVKKFIESHILWPTINPDITSTQNSTVFEVKKDVIDQKEISYEGNSHKVNEAALLYLNENVNTETISKNNSIKSHTLVPDAIVTQDKNDKNQTSNYELPLNTTRDETETSVLFKMYDLLNENGLDNNPYFNFKPVNQKLDSGKKQSKYKFVVNTNKLSNEPVSNDKNNDKTRVIENNTLDEYSYDMNLVPQIPINTTPKDDFDEIGTLVNITPKVETVNLNKNEPLRFLIKKAEPTMFDGLDKNPIINTKKGEVNNIVASIKLTTERQSGEPLTLEKLVTETNNIVDEENNSKYLQSQIFNPDSSAKNIRAQKNTIPDFEVNYFSNPPKAKQVKNDINRFIMEHYGSNHELFNHLKYLEHDENNIVSGNPYLAKELSLQGINSNAPKQTSGQDTAVQDEEFLSYQDLYQILLQIEQEQAGKGFQHSVSQNDPHVHSQIFIPDSSAKNIRSQKNTIPDFDVNYLSNTPKIKNDINRFIMEHYGSNHELVNHLKYLEHDENNIVSGNPYLTKELSLEGINSNAPKQTTGQDTTVQDEEFLSYQDLYQRPLQIEQEQTGEGFQHSVTQNDPHVSIFWKKLKEENPELFMSYVSRHRENKLNISSDSFLTESTPNHLKIEDSYPILFDPHVTQSTDFRPNQNSNSVGDLWQLLFSNKDNTTPEPNIIVADDNNDNEVANNDKSVVFKPTSNIIDATAMKPLAGNILRHKSFPNMLYSNSPYENNRVNHLMMQNPPTDWSKYSQLLYNSNRNNIPNIFKQYKQEQNSNVYGGQMKLLEMQHSTDYMHRYNNPYAYETLKQNPYFNRNHQDFNNNVSPYYRITSPQSNDLTTDSGKLDKPYNLKQSRIQLLNIFDTIKTHLNEKGMNDEMINTIISNVHDGLPDIEKEECPVTQYRKLVDKIRDAVESVEKKGK